jgi:mannose-6-phosphate isomerase
MACINFSQGAIVPVIPQAQEVFPVLREKLIHCDHFGIWRLTGEFPFTVGADGICRVLVCLEGKGKLEHAGLDYSFGKGDVFLLPAAVGACPCQPNGNVTLLEIALPEVAGES